MASLADLILQVEDKLYGMAAVERPMEDTITDSPASGATTMDVTNSNGWARGDYAEFVDPTGAVGEVVILAADLSGNTATIRRGQRGTTAAAHTSGDVIRKNPKYTRRMIEREIESVVRGSLWPKVWYKTERTLTWDPTDFVYDLAAEDYDVLQVYQYDIQSDGHLRHFDRGWWDVITQINTAVSSTNKALKLSKVYDDVETVYYTAVTKPLYANLANFPDTIADLIPWAVTGRILGGVRTAPRRYDPNRDALPEVQEGGTTRDWRYFENIFQLMLDEEHRRLRYEERGYRQKVFRPNRPRNWTR